MQQVEFTSRDAECVAYLSALVTVELCNLENDETVSYQIVGEDEADFKQGKISVTSPIARALIGKEEGEIVSVHTPGGVVEYEILEVQHL